MVETMTPKKLLTLAEQLTLADQQWLLAQLDRLIHQHEDAPPPAVATLIDEAPVLTQAEAEQQFLAEVAAFEQLKPMLLKLITDKWWQFTKPKLRWSAQPEKWF